MRRTAFKEHTQAWLSIMTLKTERNPPAPSPVPRGPASVLLLVDLQPLVLAPRSTHKYYTEWHQHRYSILVQHSISLSNRHLNKRNYYYQ